MRAGFAARRRTEISLQRAALDNKGQCSALQVHHQDMATASYTHPPPTHTNTQRKVHSIAFVFSLPRCSRIRSAFEKTLSSSLLAGNRAFRQKQLP
jgi:hypothetical protein